MKMTLPSVHLEFLEFMVHSQVQAPAWHSIRWLAVAGKVTGMYCVVCGNSILSTNADHDAMGVFLHCLLKQRAVDLT